MNTKLIAVALAFSALLAPVAIAADASGLAVHLASMLCALLVACSVTRKPDDARTSKHVTANADVDSPNGTMDGRIPHRFHAGIPVCILGSLALLALSALSSFTLTPTLSEPFGDADARTHGWEAFGSAPSLPASAFDGLGNDSAPWLGTLAWSVSAATVLAAVACKLAPSDSDAKPWTVNRVERLKHGPGNSQSSTTALNPATVARLGSLPVKPATACHTAWMRSPASIQAAWSCRRTD